MGIKLICRTPVLLYCLLFSATAHSQIKKIYLNPKTVAREKQSKFVDSLRFIPLELKDGIELGTYYSTEITEKYFLLTDYMNKRVLVYSKDGHFVKNIHYGKLGGDFNPAYDERNNKITFFGSNKNYTLTPKDLVKIKMDWENPRNKKYFKKYSIDLNDPLFTIHEEIPSRQDILRVYPYYDDYYIQGRISTSPLYKDSLDHEIKLYRNNQLVKSFFPYNQINEPRFLYSEENVSFTKADSPYTYLITRPYCDTIYRMIKDSLSPAYQLVLPLENSLPSSFFYKPFKNRTERENFSRNNGLMFRQVWNFYETPKFIFFRLAYLFNYDTYIYEKQTGVAYKTKNIKPDTSHYDLQLLADIALQRKGDRFYKSQKAGDLISFFEKNKNVAIPKELETFIKSKPPATTPMIVEFKIKSL